VSFVGKSGVNTPVAVTWLGARKWFQELEVGVWDESNSFVENIIIRNVPACDFNYQNFMMTIMSFCFNCN
jgi:hypothetical protein